MTLHATVKGYESGTNTKFGAKNCFKSHYLGYSNVASRGMSYLASCFAFALPSVVTSGAIGGKTGKTSVLP